jgi:RNA 2'-O ribose methyltransferase substrate binding
MRIASCWTAIFKNNSSFLSRLNLPQHRSISVNSGIQQGILAENSVRLRRRRPKDSRDGLSSHLNSVRSSTSRDKPAWRNSENSDGSANLFSRARHQAPRQRKAATNPYLDLERSKPGPGAKLDERAANWKMTRRKKIITDLDDLDDLDGPDGTSDMYRRTKMPFHYHKNPTGSPRHQPPRDDSQDDVFRSAKVDPAPKPEEDGDSGGAPLTLRERRKAAISHKFAEATRVKDEEEARVRGAFGTVPDGEPPPRRFPLASATSELVYGRNAIIAALRGARRRIHKLWVCQRAFVNKDRNWHDCRREAALIEQLVRDAGAEVAFVSRHWLSLMDAVAGYRQHNVS